MTDIKKTILVSILLFMLVLTLALNVYTLIVFNTLTIQSGDPTALKGILIGNILGSVAIFIFILSYVFLYEQGYGAILWEKITKKSEATVPAYPKNPINQAIKDNVKPAPSIDEKKSNDVNNISFELNIHERTLIDDKNLASYIEQVEKEKGKPSEEDKKNKKPKLGELNDLKNKFRLYKSKNLITDQDKLKKIDDAIQKLEQSGYGHRTGYGHKKGKKQKGKGDLKKEDTSSQYIHLIFLILSCVALGGSNIATHFLFNNLTVKQDDNYKIFNNLIYFAPWMYFSVASVTGIIWFFFYYAGKGEEECNKKIKEQVDKLNKIIEKSKDDLVNMTSSYDRCNEDRKKYKWKEDEQRAKQRAIIDLSKQRGDIEAKIKAVESGQVIDLR